MADSNGYEKQVLVTTDWLAEHGGDENVVVAEVDENHDPYEDGHIPGAVKLHWRDDLQDPVERDIVDRESFERLLGERGISNDTTVVLYGDKNNWFAAYAYWYLKIYGHEDEKWIDEARELTTETPSAGRAQYAAKEADESIRVRRDDVLQGLGRAGRALVDVAALRSTQASCWRALPHRRAQRAHLVRPVRAARVRRRQELRRLVD